jgi:MarR family transcriptional regulator, transcriptional regulator for hemolysin
MSDSEERFANALHATARAWRQAIDRRLKGVGLSQASWMALTVAARAEAPMSQTELAERLGVEAATMVSMVDRLAKAGLLIRQPSPSDRRVNLVVLTESGLRTVDVVKSHANALRKELLDPVDPKKLAAATELLEMLQQVIASQSG